MILYIFTYIYSHWYVHQLTWICTLTHRIKVGYHGNHIAGNQSALFYLLAYGWNEQNFAYNFFRQAWGLNERAAIWQMTFWNAFSWKKIFLFWFEFHWNFFLRVQSSIFIQVMVWYIIWHHTITEPMLNKMSHAMWHHNEFWFIHLFASDLQMNCIRANWKWQDVCICDLKWQPWWPVNMR